MIGKRQGSNKTKDEIKIKINAIFYCVGNYAIVSCSILKIIRCKVVLKLFLLFYVFVSNLFELLY